MRKIALILAIILLTILWIFTLWILQEPPKCDPWIWSQYKMTDARGH
jgi:hypothetical protein